MSRFVSGGAIQDGTSPPPDEWAVAQQELDTKRQLEQSQPKTQEGGKSLYEVLQANRAAKQEKFEESIRLKNQFRSLDDEEVEFLDSVLESTRAKDAAIRQETQSQLEEFRQRQDRAEEVVEDDDQNQDQEQSWSLKRKRKKSSQAGNFKGLKLRRSSSSAVEAVETPNPKERAEKQSNPPLEESRECHKKDEEQKTKPVASSGTSSDNKNISLHSEGTQSTSKTGRPNGLGLAGYSSDESD